jgi:hypothetical protein
MWWLWIIGPIAAGLVFVLTGKVDQRALKEIEAWREQLGARRSKLQKKAKPAGDGKKKEADDTVWRGRQPQVRDAAASDGKKKKGKDHRPKAVGALAREFADVIEEVGEGRVVGQYELASKVAYARFVTADIEGGSDHQTVLVRLAEPGPAFTAKPLPLLDEQNHLPNTGIEFRKDPEFFSTYLVEADATLAKEIGRWLSRDLRQLIREHGDVWLCVRGRAMALTVYGPIREEKSTSLVELAEVFVAEHGAEDGPSLFGETDRTNVKGKDETDAGDAESKVA